LSDAHAPGPKMCNGGTAAVA